MAKKHKHGKNHQEVHFALKRDSSVHAICLVLTTWRFLFTKEDNKVIIAEALNYLTCYKNLNLKGYLITSHRLFLIINTEWLDLEDLLMELEERLKSELFVRLQWLYSLERAAHAHQYLPKDKELPSKLFKSFPIVDYNLIRLLTGKHLNINYYDPKVARLVDKLRKADYCSYIDYSGAIGPVFLEGYCGDEEIINIKTI